MLSNRAMIRPHLNKTVYELIKGKKPDITHFRMFGCKCFFHINNKNNLAKLDPRSHEGISVGYASNSKAYKVFNKRTKVVEKSVHVIFDESTTKKVEKTNEEEDGEDLDNL